MLSVTMFPSWHLVRLSYSSSSLCELNASNTLRPRTRSEPHYCPSQFGLVTHLKALNWNAVDGCLPHVMQHPLVRFISRVSSHLQGTILLCSQRSWEAQIACFEPDWNLQVRQSIIVLPVLASYGPRPIPNDSSCQWKLIKNISNKQTLLYSKS